MPAEMHDGRVGMLRSSIATAGVGFCHFLALFVFLWVSASVMNRYEDFCAARHAVLPDVSLWAIRLSHWMRSYWYLLVLGLVPDAIVYFLLARLKPTLNWLATIWATVPLLFTIVALGLIATGMYLPLERLSPSSPPSTAESPR